MKIIRGFSAGKKLLARQPSSEFAVTSPAMRDRLKATFGRDMDIEEAVKEIIENVRKNGDAALIDYTRLIDKVAAPVIEVSRRKIEDAYKKLEPELRAALELAADRIRDFHEAEKKKFSGGSAKEAVTWLVKPLERVGCYVPGGTAAYPSTVLMTAVPAKVAGVPEVVLTTPPGKDGRVPPITLAAAKIAGVDRVFALGGAQAIAALAYGTDTVPRVDKICGPGNIFVVLAKKMVFGLVDIDSLPGPSEVLIIADGTADPAYCASDLLAQAEHDTMASAYLVTTSATLAKKVDEEVKKQMADLPRRAIAAEVLKDHAAIIVVKTIEEATELANLYAPEHLCLIMDKAADVVAKIKNAGCIVAGKRATVALGDYVAGPSHVLPTSATARFSSPLNIGDFVKIIDIINVDRLDIKKLGTAAARIARAEGLEAHARAAEKRIG